MAIKGIIVQARMGSSRLPGKVLMDLAGATVLERLFERLRRVKGAPRIVLATTTQPGDDVIADHVSSMPGIGLWRGPDQDVLKRFAEAAQTFDLDPVVRITADNPLTDAGSIDPVLDAFFAMPGCQYADNLTPQLFPYGYGVQVVSRATLDWLDRNTVSERDREHVLVHIQDNPGNFRCAHVTPDGDFHPELRITLDHPEDLILIRAIFENLYPQNHDFGLKEIFELQQRNPHLFAVNSVFVMPRPDGAKREAKRHGQR